MSVETSCMAIIKKGMSSIMSLCNFDVSRDTKTIENKQFNEHLIHLKTIVFL